MSDRRFMSQYDSFVIMLGGADATGPSRRVAATLKFLNAWGAN